MFKLKNLIVFILSFIFFVSLHTRQLSGEEWLSGVYLTGVNCPNCQKTDPFIFNEFLDSSPDVILFKYEFDLRREENRGKRPV